MFVFVCVHVCVSKDQDVCTLNPCADTGGLDDMFLRVRSKESSTLYREGILMIKKHGGYLSIIEYE